MPLVLRRLWIQVTADRKRFGVLIGALAIGVLLWARIIVVSQPPRRAMAEDGAESKVSTKVKSEEDAKGRGHAESENGERDVYVVRLSASYSRDPFAVSDQDFPKPTIIPTETKEQPKSNSSAAENALSVEIQRTKELSTLVDRMRLEAVMRRAGLAVIDGGTYQAGDSFPAGLRGEATFKVIEVLDRSIRLECEGRTFEIRLAQ